MYNDWQIIYRVLIGAIYFWTHWSNVHSIGTMKEYLLFSNRQPVRVEGSASISPSSMLCLPKLFK